MKKFLLAFILSIAFLLVTTNNTSAQGTFSCAPAPICTINNISCDPDHVAPGNLGSNCQSLGYECDQEHKCITPPPTPTPAKSTNTYDCSPAPLCYAINIDCDSEHQVGPCGSGGVICDSTGNKCIESALLPNTCSCGPAPICAVLDNQCRNGYYCPCGGPNCDQSNIDCIKIGVPIPGVGIQPTPCEVGTPREGIQTALGCIPTKEPTQFIAWLLGRVIGIGGGIAFLLMIFAGFQIITSTGDPQKLQAGKELLTSAIIGLIFIIFSLFLLELIGVRILQIPGFGK